MGKLQIFHKDTKILTGFMKKVGRFINGQMPVAITLKFYRMRVSYLKK
jgi:hypothetical protein